MIAITEARLKTSSNTLFPQTDRIILEPGNSITTRLTSRAVLAFGALAAVWLVFAGLVVLRVDAERTETQLSGSAMDGPREIRPVVVQPLAGDANVSEEPIERNPARSLENAADEPLVDELTAFFLHIQSELGQADARIPAELSTYVSQLVTRINAGGELFVVRLYDPSLEVARRQAVRGHALLVEAGLQLWLLETYGERGPATVSVSRA